MVAHRLSLNHQPLNGPYFAESAADEEGVATKEAKTLTLEQVMMQ